MLIVCPTCRVSYDTGAGGIAAGRTVACSQCGTRWVPVAAPAEPALAPAEAVVAPVQDVPAVPIVEPIVASVQDEAVAHAFEAPADPVVRGTSFATAFGEERLRLDASRSFPPLPAPAPTAGSRVLPILWVASLLILTAAVASSIRYREAIERSWPPSARVYASLGLDR